MTTLFREKEKLETVNICSNEALTAEITETLDHFWKTSGFWHFVHRLNIHFSLILKHF